MVVTLAFLTLMVISVYVIPADKPRGRVPGYPFTPIGFLIPVAVVIFLATARSPLRTGVGAGIVLVGFPVYWFFLQEGRRTSQVARPTVHSSSDEVGAQTPSVDSAAMVPSSK
jgi:hypothetical protein